MDVNTVKGAAQSLVSLSDTQLMALIVLAVVALMWKVVDELGRGRRKQASGGPGREVGLLADAAPCHQFTARIRFLIDPPYAVAQVYGQRGQADQAFEWLDRAAVQDPGTSGSLNDPALDTLHGDPRGLPFLRKIGYAPEQVAKFEFKVVLPGLEVK